MLREYYFIIMCSTKLELTMLAIMMSKGVVTRNIVDPPAYRIQPSMAS